MTSGGPRGERAKELARKEEARCQPILDSFVRAYGVKPFKHGPHNVGKLFRQGSTYKAARDGVRAVFGLEYRANFFHSDYGVGDLFDHVEMWGRDGTPLFLIGHPYGRSSASFVTDDGRSALGQDGAAVARGLAMAGAFGWFNPRPSSWYGHGTHQILVCHPPTVERVTGVKIRPIGHPIRIIDGQEPGQCASCGKAEALRDIVYVGIDVDGKPAGFIQHCKACAGIA